MPCLILAGDTSNMGRVTHVVSSRPDFEDSVLKLCQSRGLHVLSHRGPVSELLFETGDAVVVRAPECLPAACAELVSGGAQVIVLGAGSAERQYLAAGASACVPLAPEPRRLLEAIVGVRFRIITDQSTAPAQAARTKAT